MRVLYANAHVFCGNGCYSDKRRTGIACQRLTEGKVTGDTVNKALRLAP